MKELARTIYMNWCYNALLGGDPVAVDEYLNANLEIIKEEAKRLLNKVGHKPTPAYRGVILENVIDGCLHPHANFTYLSFSLDKKIARSFADPSANGFGSLFHLGNYGYVIEYTPKFAEILYHPKFLEVLPLQKLFVQAGWGDKTLLEQQEVIVLQPAEPFTNVVPLEKFTI